MRDRALLERLPQLVGPARPRLADDVDRVRRRPAGLGPVEQHAGDRLVEQLVGRAPTVAARSGRTDRGRSRRRSPRPSPSDPTRPTSISRRLACGWRWRSLVRAARCRSAPRATGRRGPARPRCPTPRSPRGAAGVAGRSQAHDLVVPAVPILQLAIDVGQQARVIVDCEQNRPGHGGELYAPHPEAHRLTTKAQGSGADEPHGTRRRSGRRAGRRRWDQRRTGQRRRAVERRRTGLTSSSSARRGRLRPQRDRVERTVKERSGSCTSPRARRDASSGAAATSCWTEAMSVATLVASALATAPSPPGASPTRCVVISSDWSRAVAVSGRPAGCSAGGRREEDDPADDGRHGEANQQPRPPRRA